MRSVRYHFAAAEELLSEIGYLEQQASGLGRRLFLEVQRAEQVLARHPEAGGKVSSSVRKFVLPKFRYAIFYTLVSSDLLVLAVAHTSRKPGYWKGRK